MICGVCLVIAVCVKVNDIESPILGNYLGWNTAGSTSFTTCPRSEPFRLR